MNTDMILQGFRIAEIEQQRLRERLMNDQLRIARMSRPSQAARLANALGLTLISIGERLRREPATSLGTGQAGASTARTI